MKGKSIAECSPGAFCTTFDLHEVSLEKKFWVFLRVVVLHRFYFRQTLGHSECNRAKLQSLTNSIQLYWIFYFP